MDSVTLQEVPIKEQDWADSCYGVYICGDCLEVLRDRLVTHIAGLGIY